MNNILKLTEGTTCAGLPNGWFAVDSTDEAQRVAMHHFSDGCFAVSASRLSEVKTIAALHGWEIIVVEAVSEKS